MKKIFSLLTVLSALLIFGYAQNTSPYWSLAGNSNATSSSKLGTTNAISLRFYTNNVQRMIINSSNGAVGIGTTTPDSRLHVNSSAGQNAIRAQVNGSTKFFVDDLGGTSIGGTSTPPANGLYVSGSVGIGTATPSFKLQVMGAAYGISGSGTSYGVYGSSTSGYGVTGSSGYLGVYGSGSTYGLYGSGGTYGAYASGSSYGVYGTSSGGYGVAGISSSSYAVYGSGYIGTIGYGTYAGAWGDGDTYGLVGYGGPYGVWATGTSYAGHFQGSVYSTGTYQGSDKALKKNITEFNSAMDIINKLKPRQYEFRSDGNYTQMNLPSGSHYGLIAQDVEQVLPNVVKATEFNANMKRPVPLKTDRDGKPVKTADNAVALKPEIINFKAVNYIELIPIIIKAMQEQDIDKDKKISDLQNQINELKSLVQALTKQGNNTSSLSTAFLKQNAPNPSNNNTVIGYYIPDNVSNAQIKITDIKGSVIKTFDASKGEGQLNLKRGELPAGTYNYTLYINNKTADTKQMILVR